MSEENVFLEHIACPECRKNGRDLNGDNLAVYSDGSAHCFHPECKYRINNVKDLDESDVNLEELREAAKKKPKKARITTEQKALVKDNTSDKGRAFRGINDETLSFYGVRTEYDGQANPIKRYYPITEDYEAASYKVRDVSTKKFYWIGKGGKGCDFAGEIKFKNLTGKTVLIVGGEEDMLAAQQMLWAYSNSKRTTQFGRTPVIAPIAGEGCKNFAKEKYAYLNKAKKIIVGLDNDEAGREATKDLVKVLPRGKTFIAEWPLKDPNDCLQKDKHQEFINAFFKAEKVTPEGITSSNNLEEKMLEYVSLERLSLPKFMRVLQDMLAGGFPLGYIVNILAASGIGKSTFIDQIILHWIMNTERTVGIVSLEASDGEYGVNLSSAYCGFKVNLLATSEERVEYLQRPENVEKRSELWSREDGSPRFYLVDSDIEDLQAKVEELVLSFGCKVIVLDPLQDIFDMLEQDEQAMFMKWQKDLVKREKVLIVNINHSRKAGTAQKAGSKGAELNEEDMHGNSAIFKSGAINIILSRNKEAAEEMDRNTTKVKCTKARGVGNTGKAGEIYYDNKTHTLWDKQEWIEEQMEDK